MVIEVDEANESYNGVNLMAGVGSGSEGLAGVESGLFEEERGTARRLRRTRWSLGGPWKW